MRVGAKGSSVQEEAYQKKMLQVAIHAFLRSLQMKHTYSERGQYFF